MPDLYQSSINLYCNQGGFALLSSNCLEIRSPLSFDRSKFPIGIINVAVWKIVFRLFILPASLPKYEYVLWNQLQIT